MSTPEVPKCGQCILFSQSSETRAVNEFIDNPAHPYTSEIISLEQRFALDLTKMRLIRTIFDDEEYYLGIKGCVGRNSETGVNLSDCVSETEFFNLDL